VAYLELLVHELVHITAYLLLAFTLIIFLKLKEIPYKDILLGLLVTVGMDVDHLFDFFLYKGKITFNIKEFIELNYFELLGKTYIPLHAWEWVALLLIIYLVLKKKYRCILFVALGVFAQLLIDSLAYGFDWRVYFITYRYLNNFNQVLFTVLPG